MKKNILLVLLVAFLAITVGISGCLNNDNNNSTDNTTPDYNTNVTFSESIVQVNPIPTGFELLVVRNATADTIGGITDEIPGYNGAYQYNNSPTDGVYLYAFQAANNTAAAGLVQKMIDAHKEAYPVTQNVTSVKINGHDATLLTKTGSTGAESYELAWTNGDILVVVNGPAGYDLMKIIAEASKL